MAKKNLINAINLNNNVIVDKLRKLAEASIEVGYNGMLGMPNFDGNVKAQRNLHENLEVAFGEENLRAFEATFEGYGSDIFAGNRVDEPDFETAIAFLYEAAEVRFDGASRCGQLAIRFGVALANSEHVPTSDTTEDVCDIADEDIPF